MEDTVELFQDDNMIWHCKGRIQNADVSFSAKHPAFLSKDHPLTTLLARRAHERVFHGGVKSTRGSSKLMTWFTDFFHLKLGR